MLIALKFIYYSNVGLNLCLRKWHGMLKGIGSGHIDGFDLAP